MDESSARDPLRTEILTDLQLERMFTGFRRSFLERTGNESIPFMVSLACQCFNNEYVYAVSVEEQLALSRLRENFTGIRDLIVYSMYEPLWTVRDTAVQFGLDRDPDAKEIFIRQISEPAEEQEIRKTIVSFGVHSNPISHSVREQYEESPYPRWIGTELPKPRTFQSAMRERFPILKSVPDGVPVRILIAGCGTGLHPIEVAAEYPNAQVTAVDFSKASLAYAIRQARRYEISNLNFLHGDILNLDAHAEFDAIESVGVLHHMDDPAAGLRALTRALKPGGFMKLGLYSRRARAKLQEAKALIRARNIGTSAEELRAVRQEIIQQQTGSTKGAMSLNEFYYLSGFRDLLCHAHEVSFYPTELKLLLQTAGLTMLGYRGIKSPAKAEYLRKYPQDPHLRDFDLFDAFESEHLDQLGLGLQIFWVQSN